MINMVVWWWLLLLSFICLHFLLFYIYICGLYIYICVCVYLFTYIYLSLSLSVFVSCLNPSHSPYIHIHPNFHGSLYDPKNVHKLPSPKKKQPGRTTRPTFTCVAWRAWRAAWLSASVPSPRRTASFGPSLPRPWRRRGRAMPCPMGIFMPCAFNI